MTMKSYKKFLYALFFGALIIVAAFALQFNSEESVSSTTVEINEQIFRVEIAESASERVQGLSRRETLAEDEGLLFIFPEEDLHGIWMKDMFFALDIAWISEDLEIVHIEEMVSPDTYPEAFYPNVPASYVLELNESVFESKGIGLGDTIVIHSEE